MEKLKKWVSLAVLGAVLVFDSRVIGQNIAQSSSQVTQISNQNQKCANSRLNPNLIPSIVNAGLSQGSQTISNIQSNIQQANVNTYSGPSTSISTVTEQSSASTSSGPLSSSSFSNVQAVNQASGIGQQVQNINQNSVTVLAQNELGNTGQSVSAINQAASTNQNILPSYQILPVSKYPFNGNFEIPLNIEVSLPPVSIAVSDYLDTSSCITSVQKPIQSSYNSYPNINSFSSFPYFPITYPSAGCSSRTGIRDLWPIFLVALCNNNGGRCGGPNSGCGCSNCIPVPIPIPIPLNLDTFKNADDSDEEEETQPTETATRRR